MMTPALQYNITLGSAMSPTWFFFFRSALALRGSFVVERYQNTVERMMHGEQRLGDR